MPTSTRSSIGGFAVRMVVAVALVGLAALIWRVSDLLVAIFAGMVLALILRSAAKLVMRVLPLRPGWALLVAIIALLVLLALIGLLMGSRAATQFGQLAQTLPAAWDRLLARVESVPAGRTILGLMQRQLSSSSMQLQLKSMATITFGALVDAILIIFTGLFLAADPELYQRGLLGLIPPAGRQQTAHALDAAVAALAKWLKGVLLSMVIVGVITGLGLWVLGVPLALTLGLLSGLMEFVPYVGPVIAAVPAVLVAFPLGSTHALEVIVLYLGVHLVEGNLIVPLVQRWAAALPPALGIVAVVAFGKLFGLIGIIFATPLTVVAIALVNSLYVQGALRSKSV